LNQFKKSIVATSGVDLFSFYLSSSSSPFYLWHSHLSHIYASRLKFLTSTRVFRTLDSHDIFYCSGCKLTIFFALPFSKSISSSLLLLLILCILMCGDLHLYPPKEVLDIMSLSLIILLWIYLMKSRFDFLKMKKKIDALVKT